MFEGVVANLLNRILGAYLENFDPKQLNIGIWSGDVKLKNLRLKKESLDKFKLPIDVKFGHLGELTLQIPWSNLKGKPVKIIIEDLYVLASPIILTNFDPEEEEKRHQAIKQAKLKELETILKAKSQELGKDLANETFTDSLFTKIIDNLQITIKSIHIRYEDQTILTENPYSVGIHLDELSAVSTDDNWQPSFISITQLLTKKLLTLNKFSCYMETQTSNLFQNNDEILQFFQNSTPTEYLLKPVSGTGKLTINKAGSTEKAPHISSELYFEEFGVELNSEQYQDILWTASKFHWLMKTEKFRKFRPTLPPNEAPKKWFQYAANCVLDEIHEKNYKWTWQYFEKRRNERKSYIHLWKLKLENALSVDDQNTLDLLEHDLSYEDIKFYRSITRNEIKRENPNETRLFDCEDTGMTSNNNNNNNNTNNKGWFSGWWGGNNESRKEEDQQNGKNLSLTDEQRKALYDTIDYDENQITSIDVPNDRVTLQVFAQLQKGGLSIKRNKSSTNLAEVVFEGCKTQFYQRPDSMLSNFQIEEFRVEDGTGETLYKHIVSVKQAILDSNKPKTNEEPFFQISFEKNPLDGSADSKLLGKLKSMTIFYNPKFVEEVIKFFTPPKIHLDTIGAIMNAAEATVEGLTTQTRLGLEYALEEHKTVNLKLDLQAPLIIMPLDPKSFKSPVAILDAGRLSVVSDLVEKSKIQQFKDKINYTMDDWKNLTNLMYDKFHLNLRNAQFLVGHDIKSTMEQLHRKGKRPDLILGNFDLNLLLGVSILPDAHNLAKIKLGGKVSEVKLSINDYQYKTLMKIIDAAVPSTESTLLEESSVFDAFGENNEDLEIEDVEVHSRTDVKSESNDQRQFQFDFCVETVQISLLRCIDGVTLEAEPLIDIIGDSLNLDFYKTLNDLHLKLSVSDITCIDHIEKSGVDEFQKLITSNANGEKGKNLLNMTYSRIQRSVDYNGKHLVIFDQDIDMQIATVKFIISRMSLLSILNFMQNTFTDTNAAPTPADELNHNSVDEEAAPQKINLKVSLDSIILVLNEDGLKLATIQLSSAEILLFLLPEAMDVKGKLGDLSLEDETNQVSTKDHQIRNLISIQGHNLAEFSYKTFDAKESKPSEVELKTGAVKINFIESSFNRVFTYLNQFQKMKSIYDSTREAAINQAAQLPNQIKFNLNVQAPTIVFPLMIDDKFKEIVADLGELYAFNEYKQDVNAIKFGIRNISLLSNTSDHIESMDKHTSEILKDLDIDFDVDWVEKYVKGKTTFAINGKIPDLEMLLTDDQLKMLIQLSDSVTRAFALDDSDNLEDVEEEAANANEVLKHEIDSGKVQRSSNELKIGKVDVPENHKLVDFTFSIPKLSLTIGNQDLQNFEIIKLSTFTLNAFDVNFEMNQNTSFASYLKIKSFVVEDVRQKTESKFPIIIPNADDVDNQFVLSANSSENKNITFMLTIEKPRTILALDYLFELQTFFNKATQVNQHPELKPSRKSISSSNLENKANVKPQKIGFSINIIQPSVILLANDADENTEAIVFKVEQVLITKQNIISLAANNIGMYLALMSDSENKKYRIIDDFSISFAHDDRGSTATEFLTNIQASIDPLIIRVSLRDIRLAVGIVNRGNELYNKHQGVKTEPLDDDYKLSEDLKRKLSHYAPSIVSSFSNEQRTITNDIPEGTVIVKGEEFSASVGGLRFVLIGDVSELPVVDVNIKPFETRAINWSTDLSAEIHVEHFINIFNYAKSAWEPLIEPWPIAIYASKSTHPQSKLLIEVISRHLAEITITSKSVALLSQISNLITSDEKLKPRGQDYPYVIVNESGFDINVWASGSKDKITEIKCWESCPWTFEDWRKIRENLDTNSDCMLGVSFIDSPYQDINNVKAGIVGEELYVLYPPKEKVHNRLSVDIVLRDDNVKIIKIKSTISIENDADIPIIINVADEKEHLELEIPSKEFKSIPITLVYNGKLRIKPQLQTSYGWSKEEIYWKQIMRSGISLKCLATNENDHSIYHFQAEAIYDEDEPLAKVYPHFKLVVSAPLEIENLLPFDFKYRLYDKNAGKDWTGTVKKGVKSYVHVVSLENLLLLSVEPENGKTEKSRFAIINQQKKSDFEREDSILMKYEDGRILKLRIYYPRKQKDSTSLKVVIYSPYVILNRSNLNLFVEQRGNAIQQLGKQSGHLEYGVVKPFMFSFDKDGDRKNRAIIKADDTDWSPPMSFDAIGQSNEVKLQINGKQKEINLGVTISEGEGKYNLTKVISIAPRYVFMNKLDEDLLILETGTTKDKTIKAGEFLPLYELRNIEKKSIMVKFLQNSDKWSPPFAIDDVGQLFIKIYKNNIGQVLVKATMLLENATMFIHLENGNNEWPYSIRNFTNEEFYIYQNDPNINANGEIVKSETPYKPIYYKIPPKSVMPYAYDYPNAIIKELMVRSHGRERAVNLAEIGNLKPFRLSAFQERKQCIVDFNVVADGPTQSLIITNYDPSTSLYKIKGGSASTATVSTSNQTHFEAVENDENYHTKIVTKFEGFGISLVNTKNQELCYITLKGLELRYNESNLYQNVSIKLKWIQIDNQLYGGIFPIVLYPTMIPKSGQELNNHPAFSASACKVKDDTHGVLFLKYATLLLQEMTMEIDEDFLFALLDFSKFPGASWNKEHVDKLCDDSLDIPQPVKLNESNDMYFEALHLQPIQANLSFVRTERVNAEDKGSSQNTLMFFFNVLTMAIGNINDAPIRLNALFIENIRVPTPILIDSIQTHYSQAFFYQLHNIVGSADFLGNPVGLFNLLSSGVLDIFYEPYQGFVLNDRPQELGIGIAKGGLSFVKKSVFGFSDSFAKVTGSIAKGLSVATMDKKFQERRRLNTKRNKPKHALYGFASGANSFFESISSGVSGVATAPIEGAASGGTEGFFKGLGKGILGLPTKTAIGIFDLASNVGEGIRNTTTVFDNEALDKVRLPRFIDSNTIIKPYSKREAQGQFWMHSIDGGLYYNERYLAHLLLAGQEKAILVTYKKIFMFDINKLLTEWIIDFDKIKAISVMPTGLNIEFQSRKGQFIPIPDRAERTFIYNKISIAVEEFNKHCQVIL
ncbi:unnamed protein product [Candida verbasci]|uniref:Vacuolar protein sorting-associated protein n=1 Tax=Candida verbasci TaxID=1227364 RepID=A0A9W4TW99_9ASCO|nr:unnamed protein product [Candida verbasci]